MLNTIETRLFLDKVQESEIDSCIVLWSTYYRKVWKLWNNQHLSESQIYHKIKPLNILTSEQIGSLINKVKTEHNKIKELSKSQLKLKISKLDYINKFLIKESKYIDKYQKEIIKLKKSKNLNYSKIAKLNNSILKKQFTIKQKLIKINSLNKSINILNKRIELNTFKLCFGSSELLDQRPGNSKDKFRLNTNQKSYSNLSDWKKDWDLFRNNIWFSIGRKSKHQGNAEIQYFPNTKKLKLRLTEQTSNNRLKIIAKNNNLIYEEINDNKNHKYSLYRMQSRFLEISNVEFCLKNQVKIQQALNNKQPITAKIIKKLSPNNKDIGYYLQLSFDEIISELDHIKPNNLTMGIDLNQKGLAYCIVKPDGNKLSNKDVINSLNYKPYGFIQWELEDKTTEQREWLISNKITELLAIAQEYGIYNIAIENLDFSSTINDMNSGYKSNQQYNKMLTQFAKSKFSSMIKRKTERLNMKLYLVNPTYSSVGGYAKYGIINKLPVDISASLWIARQSILGDCYKKENHIKLIKKYKEGISFPYLNQLKQSKRLNLDKNEWKEISSALGKNRKHWYKNLMNFINPTVEQSLSIQNPFE